MFSFSNMYSNYQGDLTFKKKLEIDQALEGLQGSNAYIYGSLKIEKQVYELLENSSGECYEYLLSRIKENTALYEKFAPILLEITYQKMPKNKEYTKASLKKAKTSRDWIEKKNKPKKKQSTVWSSFFDYSSIS